MVDEKCGNVVDELFCFERETIKEKEKEKISSKTSKLQTKLCFLFSSSGF
jgi:hypothetical protein